MVKRAGSFSILAIGRIRSSVRKSTCHDDPHSANGLVDMALSGHARQEAPLLCQISFAAIVCLVCILAKFMEKAKLYRLPVDFRSRFCHGSLGCRMYWEHCNREYQVRGFDWKAHQLEGQTKWSIELFTGCVGVNCMTPRCRQHLRYCFAPLRDG